MVSPLAAPSAATCTAIADCGCGMVWLFRPFAWACGPAVFEHPENCGTKKKRIAFRSTKSNRIDQSNCGFLWTLEFWPMPFMAAKLCAIGSNQQRYRRQSALFGHGTSTRDIWFLNHPRSTGTSRVTQSTLGQPHLLWNGDRLRLILDGKWEELCFYSLFWIERVKLNCFCPTKLWDRWIHWGFRNCLVVFGMWSSQKGTRKVHPNPSLWSVN